jgi:hypothetical protein
MAAEAEEARIPIGFGRQLGYAFIGLLAGNAAIAAVFLSVYLAAFLHSRSFAAGWSASILLGYAGLLTLYGAFSLLGWVVVGLPAVFLIPLPLIRRLSWPLILLIAAVIGIAALFLIFFLLMHGHITSDVFSFQRAGVYWVFGLLASTVGFSAYCRLVRRYYAS